MPHPGIAVAGSLVPGAAHLAAGVLVAARAGAGILLCGLLAIALLRPFASRGTVAATSWTQQGPQLVLQVGHGHPIDLLAVSADGAYLATAARGDTTVNLWNLNSGEIEARIPGGWSRNLHFSPDSRRLLCPNAALIWDIAANAPVPASLPGVCGAVNDAGITPDEKTIWTYEMEKRDPVDLSRSLWHLKCRHLAGGQVERTISGIFGSMSCVFSPDCSLALASLEAPASNNSYAAVGFAVWELAQGKEVTRLQLPGCSLDRSSLVFSPDSRQCAALSRDWRTLVIWDVHSGAVLQQLSPESMRCIALAFSPDGRQLAVTGCRQDASRSGMAIVWDSRSGRLLHRLHFVAGALEAAAFMPDGKQLVTAAQDGSIQRWELATEQVASTLSTAITPIGEMDVAASPDGQRLAVSSRDTLTCWDLTRGCVSRQISRNDRFSYPLNLSFSPDGHTLFEGGGNALGTPHSLTAWDMATGAARSVVPPRPIATQPSWAFYSAGFTPDGQHAVSRCFEDPALTIWDTRDWHVARAIPVTTGRVLEYNFTHDSTGMAWITDPFHQDGKPEPPQQLAILSLAGKQPVTRSIEPHHDIGCLQPRLFFSQDDKTLYTVSENDGVGAWEAMKMRLTQYDGATGKTLREYPLPEMLCRVYSLCSGPDAAHMLATCSAYGSDPATLAVWDVHTDYLRTFPLTSPSAHLYWQTPANTLFTYGNDTVMVWDMKQLLSGTNPRPRATIYTFTKGRWLALTPDGYYDCSPGLEDAIRWRQNGKLYPANQFAAQYHRQDLVQQALSGS